MFVKGLFFVCAVPAVVRAARRLRHCSGEKDLEKLANAMRHAAPLPSFLRNPLFLAGTVDRLIKVLPPANFGPCLKKSLILLDLWTGCGLEPKLHLGAAIAGQTFDFHAWISAGDLHHGRRTHVELWSF
jgi:Transglutaminase-like superfamily